MLGQAPYLIHNTMQHHHDDQRRSTMAATLSHAIVYRAPLYSYCSVVSPCILIFSLHFQSGRVTRGERRCGAGWERTPPLCFSSVLIDCRVRG